MRGYFIFVVISALLYATNVHADYDGDFFKAIAQSDVAEVRRAIDQGVNLKQKYNKKEQPFEYALVYFKNPVILKLLIDKTKSFDWKLPISGKSVLLTALKRYPDAEIIASLLKKGANPKDVDEKGNGSLIYAYRYFPDTSIFNMLIQRKIPVDQQDETGKTVLQLAVLDGNVRAAEAMLENGADMNRPYDDEEQPLQKAIQNEDEEMVQLLIDFGAEIYPENIKDKTLLMLAVQNGKKETIPKMLVDAGISVQERDAEGKTALMYAAEHQKNLDTFDFLLRQGAYGYTQDKQGKTAFDYLEKSTLPKKSKAYERIYQMLDSPNYLPDFFELVKYGTSMELLQAIKEGADVNIPAPSGLQPVFLAAQYALHSGNFEVLVRSGARLDVRDKIGRTPLVYAVASKNKAVLESLLEKKIDIDAIDKHGDTALIFLAQYAQDETDIEFMQKLIDADANVNTRNISGKTALMTAAEFNSFPDIIALLLENGAKVSYKTILGQTAADLADENFRLRSREDFDEIRQALKRGRFSKTYMEKMHHKH